MENYCKTDDNKLQLIDVNKPIEVQNFNNQWVPGQIVSVQSRYIKGRPIYIEFCSEGNVLQRYVDLFGRNPHVSKSPVVRNTRVKMTKTAYLYRKNADNSVYFSFGQHGVHDQLLATTEVTMTEGEGL